MEEIRNIRKNLNRLKMTRLKVLITLLTFAFSVVCLNGQDLKPHLFSTFAKKYVEEKINEWQKKGEFETTTAWQQRVTESTRLQKANEFAKEAEKKYIEEQTPRFIWNLILGKYDADNQTFLIINKNKGFAYRTKMGNIADYRYDNKEMLVFVPRNKAQSFKENWGWHDINPKYIISNDQLELVELSFEFWSGDKYKYTESASLNYTQTKIDYNFAPLEMNISTGTTKPQQGQQNISTTNLTAGSGTQVQQQTAPKKVSDVATNIPKNTQTNSKTLVLIIANEEYQYVSNVEFSKNDGEIFRQYCIQTLGVPEKNVKFLTNATLSNISREVSLTCQIANALNGEASIIFFYAGHGVPDEKSESAYLLPVDCDGKELERYAYKLDELYREFGKTNAQKILVIMDACFSGAQRGGEMITAARGVKIKPKPSMPEGNTIVFSATHADEAAYPYKEQGHGLFTYFLLKKLQESKGNATLGELFDYISQNVKIEALQVNRNTQTPTVTPAKNIDDKWRVMKLK